MLRGSESTEQSVGNEARAKQVREGGERCGLSVGRPVQVSPRSRDQRARAVGQHEHEQQLAASMLPAQHLQRPSLEGMTPADDGHALRVAVEMLVMGIVSCLPSTRWTAGSFWE